MRSVLLLAALVAAPTLAQSPLVFDRDTLVYLDASRDHATAVNMTADSLVVDSLAMRISESGFGGWRLSARTAGTEEGAEYFFIGSWTYHAPDPPPVVAPGDSLTIALEGFDPCPVCRTDGSRARRGGEPMDTLLVYVDGRVVPHRLLIDRSLWVDAEPAPDASALALAVGPNPADDRVAVRLTLPAPVASAVAAVYDGLGRRVAVLHDGPLAAGAHTVEGDAGAWPAGVYVVRVTAGRASATARLTVVR